MKTWYIPLIIIGILFIILIILLMSKKKERNIFTFPETFQVTSLIESSRDYDITDLVKVIGNKIMGYDTANITIYSNNSILNKYSTKDIELQAILYKNIVPHTYSLIIREDPGVSLESIICHEMVHFDQNERGDLVMEEKDNKLYFIWKGKKQIPLQSYASRPWEKEASQRQWELWNEFKNLYYK